MVVLFFLTSTAWGAQQLKTAVGQKFTITLQSNATTGYSWQLAKPIESKMLKFLGSKYSPKVTGLVGSGGLEQWNFIALKRGRTKVSFKYVRPWEKDIQPVDTRSYQITIR